MQPCQFIAIGAILDKIGAGILPLRSVGIGHTFLFFLVLSQSVLHIAPVLFYHNVRQGACRAYSQTGYFLLSLRVMQPNLSSFARNTCACSGNVLVFHDFLQRVNSHIGHVKRERWRPGATTPKPRCTHANAVCAPDIVQRIIANKEYLPGRNV